MVGLLVDLVDAGSSTGVFWLFVGWGILIGVGIGMNVAVEPLWVGVIAGVWIINTTLNRVAVLQLAEGGSAIYCADFAVRCRGCVSRHSDC